jgi:hypothetical protein
MAKLGPVVSIGPKNFMPLPSRMTDANDVAYTSPAIPAVNQQPQQVTIQPSPMQATMNPVVTTQVPVPATYQAAASSVPGVQAPVTSSVSSSQAVAAAQTAAQAATQAAQAATPSVSVEVSPQITTAPAATDTSNPLSNISTPVLIGGSILLLWLVLG